MAGLSKNDRALGAFIGLAVGDALGTTLEFKPRDSHEHLTDMVGGGPFKLKPGQWTVRLPHAGQPPARAYQGARLRPHLDGRQQAQARHEIRSSGHSTDTLAAARWAVAVTDSFQYAVLKAVNLGGDADTVGVVTRQLAHALRAGGFLDKQASYVRSGDRQERIHRLLRDEVMNLALCADDFWPENRNP